MDKMDKDLARTYRNIDEILRWSRFYWTLDDYAKEIGTVDEFGLEMPTAECLKVAREIIDSAVKRLDTPSPDSMIAIGDGALAFVTVTQTYGLVSTVVGPNGEIEIQRGGSKKEFKIDLKPCSN